MYKLRCVIVGGCGHYGRQALGYLVESRVFSELVIADYNEEEASRIAAEIQKFNAGIRVSGRKVDAANGNELVKMFEHANVVVNIVGPYYRYGVKVIEAALKAKANYVDLCDDTDPYVEALKLDQKAKEAGVTVLMGFGGGPGLTNMLAAHCADKLDSVEEIAINFAGTPLRVFSPGLVGRHYHSITGQVPIYTDGQWVDVPALSGQEIVQTPSGPCSIGYVNHAETMTLPLNIKGVRRVTTKQGYNPTWFFERYRKLAEYGLTSEVPVHTAKGDINPIEFITNFLASSEIARQQLGEKLTEIGEARLNIQTEVIVRGREAGKPVKYTCRFLDPGRKYISFVLATGAVLLGSKPLRKGVMPAELLEKSDRMSVLGKLRSIGVSVEELREETREFATT